MPNRVNLVGLGRVFEIEKPAIFSRRADFHRFISLPPNRICEMTTLNFGHKGNEKKKKESKEVIFPLWRNLNWCIYRNGSMYIYIYIYKWMYIYIRVYPPSFSWFLLSFQLVLIHTYFCLSCTTVGQDIHRHRHIHTVWNTQTKITMKLQHAALMVAGALASSATAIEVELGNEESVCNAATDLVDGIMDYYLGTRYAGTVGMFQQPYYWWEAGLVFGGMIDTWKFCNNDTYVGIIQEAIVHQKGPDNDFFNVENQTDVEANDDQVFWGFTVMEAAERGFPMYSNDENDVNYAQLAMNVYNNMAPRWDDQNCGGGLRWQILDTMNGWDYKSMISTGGVFALGARLARYTGDDSLKRSSKRILQWMKQSKFVVQNEGNDFYNVNDGAEIVHGACPVVNGALWSYNYALMLMGSAYLYNATGEQFWDNELGLFLGGLEHYMVNTTGGNTLYEYQCEKWQRCNNDQRAFRAVVARTLGEIYQLAPQYSERVLALIDSSAAGAAASCSGGSDGKTCGINWGINGWDGLYGLGEQISALEIIQNSLIPQVPPPCEEDTCGEKLASDVSIVVVPTPTIFRTFTTTNTVHKTATLIHSSVENVFYTGTTSSA